MLVDKHCHSKVMRFEPNVESESSKLLASIERAIAE
jgi:hypothetical protein